jgi:hypothetical protein
VLLLQFISLCSGIIYGIDSVLLDRVYRISSLIIFSIFAMEVAFFKLLSPLRSVPMKYCPRKYSFHLGFQFYLLYKHVDYFLNGFCLFYCFNSYFHCFSFCVFVLQHPPLFSLLAKTFRELDFY